MINQNRIRKKSNSINNLKVMINNYPINFLQSRQMQKLITSVQKFCCLILKNYQQSIPFSLKSQIITFRSYLETFVQGKQEYLNSYIDRLEKEYEINSCSLLQSNRYEQKHIRSTNNLKIKTEVCHDQGSVNFNDSYKISDYAFSSMDALSNHNKAQKSHSHYSSIDQSINETLLMNNDENINIGNLHPQGILFKRKSDDHCLGASLGHNPKKHKRNSSNKSGDIGIAASVGSNNIKSLKIILKPKINTNFVNKPNPTQKYNINDKFSTRAVNEAFRRKNQSDRPEKSQQRSLILKSKQLVESDNRTGKSFEAINIPKPLKSARSINKIKESFQGKERLGLMRQNIQKLLKIYDQNYCLIEAYEKKYNQISQQYSIIKCDEQIKGESGFQNTFL